MGFMMRNTDTHEHRTARSVTHGGLRAPEYGELQQLVNELTQQAESALSAFSEDTAFLREFAQSLANRGY